MKVEVFFWSEVLIVTSESKVNKTSLQSFHDVLLSEIFTRTRCDKIDYELRVNLNLSGFSGDDFNLLRISALARCCTACF